MVVQSTKKSSEQPSWQPLVKGILFVSAGLAVALIGINSLRYRLTNLVVEHGQLNGRITKIQAPVFGLIQAFYAQPGVWVKSQQILARIYTEPSAEEKQSLLKLQEKKSNSELTQAHLRGNVEIHKTQLTAAKEYLLGLQRQLEEIDKRDRLVFRLDAELNLEEIHEQQAVVEEAEAKAEAIHIQYENHRRLLKEGAVSRGKTEQLRLAWQAAQAEVKQAKSVLAGITKASNASQDGYLRSNRNKIIGGSLNDQHNNLLREIQKQKEKIKTLEAELFQLQKELNQIQVSSQNRSDIVQSIETLLNHPQAQEIKAPFSGVIYQTNQEQGEQIEESTSLLSLLDCNDLWVEVIVSASQASLIAPEEVVEVKLVGHSQALAGQIDLIQPISGFQGGKELSKLSQVQALVPLVPNQLVNESLARVTVKIPPPPEYAKSHQFCGVGQSARLNFRKKLPWTH